MPDPSVVKYISDCLNAGVDRNTIEQKLIEVGHQKADIDEAFNSLNTTPQPQQTLNPQTPPITNYSAYDSENQSSGKKKPILIGLVLFLVIALVAAGGFYFWKNNPLQKNTAETKEPEVTSAEVEEIQIPNLPHLSDEIFWSADGKKAYATWDADGEQEGLTSIGEIDLENKTFKEIYKDDGQGKILSANADNSILLLDKSKNEFNLLSTQTGLLQIAIASHTFRYNYLSPNGQLIYFVDPLDNKSKVASLDGTIIAEFPDELAHKDIQWFPDSENILFANTTQRSQDPYNYSLAKYNIKTQKPENLHTIDLGINPAQFKLSPDGKKILYLASSNSVTGSHLIAFDIENNSKTVLSEIEGENIEQFQWAQDSSAAIALRHRLIEGDRHLVVFPALAAQNQKIIPLNDDFFDTDQTRLLSKNDLWISVGGSEIKFKDFEYKSNTEWLDKFMLARSSKILNQETYFKQKLDEETQISTYKDDNSGISFDYPKRWGQLVVKSTEHYSCFRFSQIDNNVHIKITSIEQVQKFIDTELEKLISQSEDEQYDDSKQACPLGVLGSAGELFLNSSLANMNKVLLDKNKKEVEYLSLVDSKDPVDSRIKNLTYRVPQLFNEGFLLPGDDISIAQNKSTSTIGLTYSSDEGYENNHFRFVNSFFTVPNTSEKLAVIKIPIEAYSDGLMSIFGSKDSEKITQKIKEKLTKEKKIVDESLTITKSAPQTIPPDKKLSLKRDSSKKLDVYILSYLLEEYRNDNTPLLSTQTENINSDNFKNTNFYKSYLSQDNPDASEDDLIPYQIYLKGNDFYKYSANTTTYQLTAYLENKEDKECIVQNNQCLFIIRNGDIISKK